MAKIPLDHLRSKKKPVVKSVWIAGDTELADAVSEMEEQVRRLRGEDELRRSRQRPGELVPPSEALIKAESKLAEMKAELKESAIQFRFRNVSPRRYDQLINEHPPTDDQVADAKKQGADNLPFNTETFPLALIAECCITPEVDSKEDLIAWLGEDSWNNAEIQTLFMTAMAACTQAKRLDLGKD